MSMTQREKIANGKFLGAKQRDLTNDFGKLYGGCPNGRLW